MGRSAKYDNLKFFLILCVVLGHLGNRFADDSFYVSGAQCWIYLFHMPAFAFVAGLFSKRTVDECRWNKYVPYIFLYLGMETLRFIISAVHGGIDSAHINPFYENGVPWYALSMFWWYLIAVLVRKVKPAYVMIVAVALALLSGYTQEVNSFLCMQRTLIFFPFFYVGYLMDPQEIIKRLSAWWIKVISGLIIAGSIVFVFTNLELCKNWRILFRGIATYNQIETGADYAYGFLWRLAAYVISFVLTFSIIALIPSVKTFIASVGQKTLPVYFFHYSVITVSFMVIPGFRTWLVGVNSAFLYLLFAIAIVFFTALPIFDWPVRKIMTVPAR